MVSVNFSFSFFYFLRRSKSAEISEQLPVPVVWARCCLLIQLGHLGLCEYDLSHNIYTTCFGWSKYLTPGRIPMRALGVFHFCSRPNSLISRTGTQQLPRLCESGEIHGSQGLSFIPILSALYVYFAPNTRQI